MSEMTFEPRFVELSFKAHILHYYPLLPHYTWRKLRQRRANCIIESTGLVACRVGGRSYIFRLRVLGGTLNLCVRWWYELVSLLPGYPLTPLRCGLMRLAHASSIIHVMPGMDC